MPWGLIAGAAIGAFSSYKSGKKAEKAADQQAAASRRAGQEMAKQYSAVGRYNSAIIKLNTRLEKMAIEDQIDRVKDQQREIYAKQKMNIRGRGGMIASGDLLSLINSASEMQMDIFQLMRTQSLAQLNGEVRASQVLYQADMNAKAAILQGETNASISKAHGDAAMSQGIMGAVGYGVNLLGKIT